MNHAAKRRRGQSGSTLVESSIVFTVFAIMLAGIMEIGFAGCAADIVCFAAHRAARYASVRGRLSGHPASAADIQTIAESYTGPLDSNSLTVNVSWAPDNNTGSNVQVTVSYALGPSLLPLSGSVLTLTSTARQTIIQ
jgi:Flp pilus assembly protein TadG